jgi:phosphoadenosine phosphosulfate reductase
VFYLDTELLFPQTYETIERVKARYGIEPVAVAPELDLAAQAAAYGDALWARDPDRCCALRKVEPQRRFLQRYDAWITGLRRDQSATRADVKYVDFDAEPAGLAKISPLADWNDDDCRDYLREHDVPYNTLADEGYPSVGCVPCTRRARSETPRAGRWAGFAKTECGLHAPAGAGRGGR